ncbi:MAG: site-specific integrase [Actinomycetota bacterium]|nr:site-specific integrase [Actinomycetota bacterium]
MAKKRGNGEGSITRRKDGLYMARYTVQTATGAKRKALYGKTRSEVAAKLSKALADREGGLTYDAGKQTVGEYLTRWLSNSVRDTVRQRTYERYESIVRVHLVPAIGSVKLKTLTPDHVRGLYREKLDGGLAARTVLHIHRVLSKALKQAVDDGLIPRNAAGSVKSPQPRGEEIRPLNREQVRIFFEAAREDRLEALYIVAVTAGLRRGELQGLKWEDVDLSGATGTLQVRRTLSEPRGGYIFEAPKSGKGRNIRLTRKATSALREHRKRQLEERMRLGTLWRDHGLIFPSGAGTPLSGGNLNRAFKALLKRAGLPPMIRFHDLRHTCATLLLRQGVNPKFVQELLGHGDVSLTLNVYSHVLPDMGDTAAGAMDDALG